MSATPLDAAIEAMEIMIALLDDMRSRHHFFAREEG
jgi:hypothetical protein